MTTASLPAQCREDSREHPSRRTEVEYSNALCLHELLEAQVLRSPDAVAVECEGVSLSYRELDARANQLAHVLCARGVKAEVLVGICLERSLAMLVSLLGVLKAGGAYVPLDPAYPAERIKFILEDADAKVLLTQQSLLESLPQTTADVICLDAASQLPDNTNTAKINVRVAPENLAYVIYTSGSTGKPKGVQVEHRSVVNLLCAVTRSPGLASQDVLVAVTTISFDIAALELYLPLCVGARLVIARREATRDGSELKQLLGTCNATVMQATPATWRLLFECGWQGSPGLKVLVGGEALSPELARRLVACCGSVWNMYGPTETTIWSSVYPVDGTDGKAVPIGKPIANTRFHVVDENREPVPVGNEGELYISGAGVARGYLHRPELTRERFVADPFSSRRGSRMYQTGDWVRCRPDGNVEFLGRLDHQVKIRGFRVELGEIEAVLEQHPAVRHAVVVMREDTPGEQRLVAYAVEKSEVNLVPGEWRDFVRRQLPDYMTPVAMVRLKALPLTPNGKVDRKSLPAPKLADFEADRNYVAPRDSTERQLARLWEDVLGIRPIGVTDSFFDLGGRSILAARLFVGISRLFGKDLPLATLFQSPTIEQLAKQLHPKSDAARYTTLVSIQPDGSKPPFFCVHGGAGSTLFLNALGRAMGNSQQPLYGIEPEGLDGRRFRRTTIPMMAAHYIAEIRKVQPCGPYYIGGYCFGGMVAFEMAHQLRSMGEQAALLVLLNAPLFERLVEAKRSSPPAVRSAAQKVLRVLSSPGRVVGWRIRTLYRHLQTWLHVATCNTLLGLGVKIPQAMRTTFVTRMIYRAQLAYVPKPYPGKLTMFRGRGLYANDPNMGWDGLAESLENCEIGDTPQGHRRVMFNEPVVGLLARLLTSHLEAARSGAAARPSALMTCNSL
ncbi:MAG: hypothetical protein JWO52_266 [Gammaproteobacteria bacterium]|nr:hypothetical protein [Gammaproteobacteria bacterium]